MKNTTLSRLHPPGSKPGVNKTRQKCSSQNSAGYFCPLPQEMLDTAPSSPEHAASHCSHVCCCRRVCVLALISRSAAVVDSISAPASGSIRFAESADRLPRCKSERFQLRGSTIRKEPQRCRPDALD